MRPRKPRTRERIGQNLVDSFYAELVAEGEIEPAGKSGDQLLREVEAYLQRAYAGGGLRAITVHADDILRQARRYRLAEKHELSGLMYATWFEHWVNELIARRGKRDAIGDDERRSLVREVSLRVKLLVLPQLLGFPRLSPVHVGTALRIAERRNAFVHYKFQLEDMDKWSEKQKSWSAELNKAELAVAYLRRFAQRHVYRGAKRRLRVLLGRNA